MSTTPSGRPHRRWLNGAFLCLLLGALFWRALFWQGAFYVGDLLRLHYPERIASLRALAQGQLPIWTPDTLAGYPLLAEGQFGPLYPANWVLHLLLPPDIALNYYVILHYLLAGVAMAALARAYRLSWGASLLAGLAYMWSGFGIAHLNHLNILAVFAWTPLLLRGVHGLIRAPAAGWPQAVRPALATAAVLALILLAGHPQMAFLAVLLALLFGAGEWLYGERRDSPARHGAMALGAALIVVALAGGLAAAQLLPTLELARLSQRAGGLDPAFFASFSLHPGYLALLVSPFLLGNPYPDLSPELVGYVGILPLLLAAAGLWSSAICWRSEMRRAAIERAPQATAPDAGLEPMSWWWAGIALLGVLLALGRWNPLYLWLLRLPLFNWFRVPARFLFWFTVALPLLAAAGADGLARALPERPLQRGRPLLAGSALLLMVGLAWLDDPSRLDGLLVAWRALPLMWVAVALALLARARRERIGRRAFFALALLLLAADLGAFASVWRLTYNATLPRDLFLAEPRVLAFFRADDTLYRTYTHEEIVPVWPVMRESLYPNLALQYGIPSANGYWPLIPQAWATLQTGLTAPLANRLNIKYVLIPQVLPVDEASEFYDVEDPLAPTIVGRTLAIPALAVQSLIVESYVSHAADQPDGRVAAEIVLSGAAGETRLPLRIGVDTAEWAYERSDVRAQVRHAMPPVARTFPARSGYPPEDHPGHIYRAEYTLPTSQEVRAVRIDAVLPRAYVRVERVYLVDAAGERHLLSHLAGESDHTLVYRSEDVAIYENHDVLPRARLVYETQVVADLDATLAMLDKTDLARIAILDGGPALTGAPAQGGAPDEGAVSVRRYAATEIVLEATTPAPAYLVLADLYYPGWEVTVDGQPAIMRRADGVLRAVYLEPGTHEVVWRYRPASFRRGVMLSGMALLVWLAAARWTRAPFPAPQLPD